MIWVPTVSVVSIRASQPTTSEGFPLSSFPGRFTLTRTAPGQCPERNDSLRGHAQPGVDYKNCRRSGIASQGSVASRAADMTNHRRRRDGGRQIETDPTDGVVAAYE